MSPHSEVHSAECINTKDNLEKTFITPFGQVTSLAKQAACDHNWQSDGQKLNSIRWTCDKCFKTELRQ